jgi:O-antigen ligase
MLAAAMVFADHPVLGVGPDMFRYYYQEYAQESNYRILTTNREAHNLFLGVAADNGILGLICFGMILFVNFRGLVHVRQHWIQTRPEYVNLANGFILAILAYLATGLFLHFAYIRYFWLLMALAGALINLSSKDEEILKVREG